MMIAAALAVISCSKDIQNSDAVKQAVVDYLKTRQTGLNMDAMTIDVTSLAFQKDQAQATVRFTPKGIPNGGMSMSYALDRKGNKWVVRGRLENGVNPHGGQALPDGSGGATPAVPMPLPPGHPSTNPSGGALPPGHPAVDTKKQ